MVTDMKILLGRLKCQWSMSTPNMMIHAAQSLSFIFKLMQGLVRPMLLELPAIPPLLTHVHKGAFSLMAKHVMSCHAYLILWKWPTQLQTSIFLYFKIVVSSEEGHWWTVEYSLLYVETTCWCLEKDPFASLLRLLTERHWESTLFANPSFEWLWPWQK